MQHERQVTGRQPPPPSALRPEVERVDPGEFDECRLAWERPGDSFSIGRYKFFLQGKRPAQARELFDQLLFSRSRSSIRFR